MRQKSITNAYTIEERKVFWGLVFVVTFLIGLYIYFVSASIVNVLMREEIIIEIATTNSRISELEMSYVTEKNKITEELAHDMGFVLASEKHFVERVLAGKSLTVRE